MFRFASIVILVEVPMSDPGTFTAEHRSWQWDMVLRYEEGSLPASEWNATTLGIVAAWYAENLPREKAIERYTDHYHKNHRRLTHRRDGATVATDAIAAVDSVWESLLQKALNS
jgi:hypothetical protein